MRVIVTTGRTEEPLTTDGVAITNGFTGRQGQEIARAFARRGAEVVVISGPTTLPDVENARTVHVRAMQGMHAAVLRELETPTDIYISAAAIADFSAAQPFTRRLSPGEPCTLDLLENPSIVKAVSSHPRRPKTVVSFAAQSPEDLLAYAVQKFEKSGADLTIANPIGGTAATTRDATRNEIYFISRRDGKIVTEKVEEMSKQEIAEQIVEKILNMSSRA